MGKQKKQREPHIESEKIAQPWWENISYKGFLQLANATFKPTLFLKVTGNEFKLLVYLTFLRWRFAEQSGQLRLGHDYLVKGTGLSQGTVRRCMKSLARKHFLRLVSIDRNNGNTYLIYTILLLDSCDQIDRTPKTSDQFDRTVRSKRSHGVSSSGTSCDQIDQEDHIQTYQRDGAPRYALRSTIEGGVESPQEEVSCRTGSDTSGQKGVGLTADATRNPHVQEVFANIDAIEQRDAERKAALAQYKNQLRELSKALTSGAISRTIYEAKVKEIAERAGQPTFFTEPEEKKKRPVGGDGKSNFHARA